MAGVWARPRRAGGENERRVARASGARQTTHPPSTAPQPLKSVRLRLRGRLRTPAWLSAAEKLGLAISAARLGCAASAATPSGSMTGLQAPPGLARKRRERFRGSPSSPRRPDGLAGRLGMPQRSAPWRRRRRGDHRMRIERLQRFAAPLSCPALLARFEKADELLPSAASRFGLRLCALLARLAKARELLAIAANTFGSALSALIALLSRRAVGTPQRYWPCGRSMRPSMRHLEEFALFA